MEIKVLGPGCPNCQTLETNTKKALEELGLSDVAVEHVQDIMEIAEYGIMSSPGIVIDGEVKAAGRVPEVDEIKGWIQG